MIALNRRSFLMGSAAACVAGPAVATADGFDENLAILISDTHVLADHRGNPRHINAFEWTADQILAMRPLPCHLIHFGDLSHLVGRKEDYELAKPVIDRLRAAGIKVTVGMGNHDRRCAYLDVFGREPMETSLVPGRIVHLVELPAVGVLMLDSLAGDDAVTVKEKRPVNGELSPEQQTWLRDFLAARRKPLVVAAHHPVFQLKVGKDRLCDVLAYSKAVVGFVHGHNHSWARGWTHPDWATPTSLHTVGLPSGGCDGDIGYCTMRAFVDRVEIELKQRDFFIPRPFPRADRPPQWDVRVRENMASPLATLFFERRARRPEKKKA